MSVTLHKFFPKGFLIKGLMSTTYMVSCHDADDQENLTKKEEKVNLEETKLTKEEGSKPMPRKKRLLYVLTVVTR